MLGPIIWLHILKQISAIISTCTWQILSVSSSICDHIWDLCSPFRPRNETTEVCSGSTQPHLQLSSLEKPHRLQGYGVCKCQGKKVNILGAASQRQCTSAHLPCCQGCYAWVRLWTFLSTTLFCICSDIRFPTVHIRMHSVDMLSRMISGL